MNELEFLAILTTYIDEYKDSHYIGAEYGQESSEILSFLAWITQRLYEEKEKTNNTRNPFYDDKAREEHTQLIQSLFESEEVGCICGDEDDCTCPHIEKKEKMKQ